MFSPFAAHEPKRILCRRPAGSPLVDAQFHAKLLEILVFLQGRHARTQNREGATKASTGNLTFPRKPWETIGKSMILGVS